MAVHIVKCKYCGVSFNRDKEPFEKVGERRYAHKDCYEKYKESFTQEELDYQSLEAYIKKLFNKNSVSARIKKQIKDFKAEHNYTYSGMQKTLYWWFELKGNSIEKANEGIGIVPFVYDQACDYYYRLYLAEIANNLEEMPEKVYTHKEVEIEIGSPRARISSPKLFDFEKK